MCALEETLPSMVNQSAESRGRGRTEPGFGDIHFIQLDGHVEGHFGGVLSVDGPGVAVRLDLSATLDVRGLSETGKDALAAKSLISMVSLLRTLSCASPAVFIGQTVRW